MKRYAKWIVLVMLLALSLSSCMPGDGRNNAEKPAGFFMGVWHGWIAPVSLVAHFFNRSLRIYETNNTGWWYDLGFYMAIISGFGGLALGRKKQRR